MMRITRLFEQSFRFFDAEDDRDAPVAADSRRSWSERRSLLVVLEDGEGHVGLGEAAPLPGYSPDSLDDAWNALAPLVGKDLDDIALGAPGSSRAVNRLVGGLASASARFALESALLDLWSRRNDEPAWALLARLGAELEGKAEPTVPHDGCAVAALLSGDATRVRARAERAAARGIRCFKLKIGVPGAWERELTTLRAIRQAFPDARLRTDANGSFSPAELSEHVPALRELALEWLEEPALGFPNGVATPLGVPVALDESLQTTAPDAAAASKLGVRAYVLKPTTLGGFVRTFELARDARSHGIVSVVSHTYEGPLAYQALAALALALGCDRPPDGLDRHPGVADMPSVPGFDDKTSRIRPWPGPGFGLGLDEIRSLREIVREVRA